MLHIEAPTEYCDKKKSLFLAGGISGCDDWQNILAKKLSDEDIILLNPRRKNFPMDNSDAAYEQIAWEFRHLRKADAISFWFPHETACPITLYELGAWLMTDKTIFIGVDPKYSRKQDVEIQSKLVRPATKVVYDLDSLARDVKKWISAN